jgi:hypothetical protein
MMTSVSANEHTSYWQNTSDRSLLVGKDYPFPPDDEGSLPEADMTDERDSSDYYNGSQDQKQKDNRSEKDVTPTPEASAPSPRSGKDVFPTPK